MNTACRPLTGENARDRYQKQWKSPPHPSLTRLLCTTCALGLGTCETEHNPLHPQMVEDAQLRTAEWMIWHLGQVENWTSTRKHTSFSCTRPWRVGQGVGSCPQIQGGPKCPVKFQGRTDSSPSGQCVALQVQCVPGACSSTSDVVVSVLTKCYALALTLLCWSIAMLSAPAPSLGWLKTTKTVAQRPVLTNCYALALTLLCWSIARLSAPAPSLG